LPAHDEAAWLCEEDPHWTTGMFKILGLAWISPYPGIAAGCRLVPVNAFWSTLLQARRPMARLIWLVPAAILRFCSIKSCARPGTHHPLRAPEAGGNESYCDRLRIGRALSPAGGRMHAARHECLRLGSANEESTSSTTLAFHVVYSLRKPRVFSVAADPFRHRRSALMPSSSQIHPES
jgi:hypothetical protein